LGLLAAKQAFRAIRKSDFFAFFQVLTAFISCKPLIFRILQIPEASQKNRAKKPYSPSKVIHRRQGEPPEPLSAADGE
jgi:hypothetical protein